VRERLGEDVEVGERDWESVTEALLDTRAEALKVGDTVSLTVLLLLREERPVGVLVLDQDMLGDMDFDCLPLTLPCALPV